MEYPTKLLISGEPLYKPTEHWDITFVDAMNRLKERFGGVGTEDNQEVANVEDQQAENISGQEEATIGDQASDAEEENGDNISA